MALRILALVLSASCGRSATPATEPAPPSPTGSASCVITTCGWRAAEVRRALAIGGDDTLENAARETAMNDAILAAQVPASGQTCPAAPVTDLALAGESAAMQEVLPILLSVIQTYRARGLVASGAAASQCARDHATRELARVASLVAAQRQFQLPSSPVADMKVYFAEQVARAAVALTLAHPFLAVQQNTQGDPQAAAYWHSSFSELQRFTQHGDRDGQVGALEAIFEQLATVDAIHCQAALAASRAVELGNDLFSNQRRALLADLQRCAR